MVHQNIPGCTAFPECIGVFRCVQRPTYGEEIDKQIAEVMAKRGPGKLEELLAGDETWVVPQEPARAP
jgi:2-oxoglutarate ferredoxin oxidoreductase subunit beta